MLRTGSSPRQFIVVVPRTARFDANGGGGITGAHKVAGKSISRGYCMKRILTSVPLKNDRLSDL
jgi:hypothetical protein